MHTALERGLLERLGTLGGKLRAGRSRNDQVATDLRLYLRDHARGVAARLVELADALVELHGQKDDRGLLDARGHRALLDVFAEADLGQVRAAWAASSAAERALDAAREALAAGARDREFLEHAVAELDRLDPQPGEEPALDARRRQMRAAARIEGSGGDALREDAVEDDGRLLVGGLLRERELRDEDLAGLRQHALLPG